MVRNRIAALAVTAGLGLTACAWGQDAITRDGVITGTMDITYNTRTQIDTSGDFKEGSPKLGVADIYKVDLNVLSQVKFSGEVQRMPKIRGRLLGRTAQDAKLTYALDISVINPRDEKQTKRVGRWVGTMPGDPRTGVYDLASGKDQGSSLRFAIDGAGSVAGYQDLFVGQLQGKIEDKGNLLTRNYTRIVKGKEVTQTVTKVDPIGFIGIELARGPVDVFPRTSVNGSLDYDYETGNWYANNITFAYMVDGKAVNDKITGTIKWVEDPQRETNGKGYYEFNLRFNEEANKPATDVGAAFDGASDLDAFFAVDTSVPTLTGRIEYVDTFVPGGDLPASTKAVYSLHANKLTRQQIVNFAKLWLLIVGPTNDE